tara:strand:- start:4869 stop:5174 length:306 start_codon:yes stop_codon:yes gene_type:complete
MAVFAFGIKTTIEGEADLYNLCANICPVRKETGPDKPVIRSVTCQLRTDDMAFTNPYHRPFGLLSPRAIKFWRVNASQSNLSVADPYGISVYDIGWAFDYH